MSRVLSDISVCPTEHSDNEIDRLEYFCRQYPKYVDEYPLTLIVNSLNTNTVHMDVFIKMMTILATFKNHEKSVHIKPSDLLPIAEDVLNDTTEYECLTKKVFYYETKYKDAMKSYPNLFIKLLSDNDMDKKDVMKMLHLASDISEAKTTRNDASIKVGEDLYKKYVKPKIG